MIHERVTTAAAAAATASPWWLPWLRDASDVAATLLPIAGLLWLVIQAVVLIDRWRRAR